MVSREDQDNVVFFLSKLTAEEEYTLMTQPIKADKDEPAQKIKGNNLLPKKDEYLQPITMRNIPRNITSEYRQIYNIVLALLACEPFFNTLKYFKERVVRISHLPLLSKMVDFIGLLSDEYKTRSDISQEIEANAILGAVYRIVEGNKAEEIFTSIILILHEEFRLKHFYVNVGWENAADSKIEKNCGVYFDISPVTELFTGEVKKLGYRKSIDVFDMLMVGKSNHNNIREIMSDYFRVSGNFRDQDAKYSFTKLPMIAAILCNKNMELESEIKLGGCIYILKSAIINDIVHNFDNINSVRGNYENVSLVFYRKVKITD